MRITETTDKQKYRSIWEQKGSHILQSWEWGDFKASRGKWKVVRLIIDDGVEIVSVLLRDNVRIGKKIAYSPRLSLSKVHRRENIVEIFDYIKEDYGVDIWLVDPNWSTEVDQDLSVIRSIGNAVQLRSRRQIQPQYTNKVLLVDKTEDDLWMGLKGKYRRNIKKSFRQGIEVEMIGGQDNSGDVGLDNFYQVMQSVAQNTKLILDDIEYYCLLWNRFSQADMSRMYIARLGGHVVGAYLNVMDQVGSYELYGGVTRQGRDVEAGYALKWEAIKDAYHLGKRFYDHWGVAPFSEVRDLESETGRVGVQYAKGHPLERISQFKNGFGGENVRFASGMILYRRRTDYLLYQVMQLAKNILVRLKQ